MSPSRQTPSTRAAIRTVKTVAPYSAAVRYGAAIAFPIAALLVTLAIAPMLKTVIFMFFWPAVIGAAIVGGLGPALFASAFSVALADWFIVAPLHSIDLTGANERILKTPLDGSDPAWSPLLDNQ